MIFDVMLESLFMECCFIYTFIQRLDYAARRFNDETGIALVEIHVDKSPTPQYVAKSSTPQYVAWSSTPLYVDKSSTPQYVAKSTQYGSFVLLV